jgi:hypothetical protein
MVGRVKRRGTTLARANMELVTRSDIVKKTVARRAAHPLLLMSSSKAV